MHDLLLSLHKTLVLKQLSLSSRMTVLGLSFILKYLSHKSVRKSTSLRLWSGCSFKSATFTVANTQAALFLPVSQASVAL